MADTVYTPSEMLGLLADYITARRAKYDALCAEIDALCAERDICDSEISAAYNAIVSF